MKKFFLSMLFLAVLSSSVFAGDYWSKENWYKIWEPISIGYSNIQQRGTTTMKVNGAAEAAVLTALGLPTEIKDSWTLSMNNFVVSPLLNYGMMRKDKGFFFMSELQGGVGNANLKFEKGDELIKRLNMEHTTGIAFNTSVACLFGYSLSPINNLYLSFASGFSGDFFIAYMAYEKTIAGATVKYEKFHVDMPIGIPFDVSVRYYFSKKVGLIFGLQDTVLFSLNKLLDIGATFQVKGKVGGEEKELFKSNEYNTSIGNKFTVKLGLSTRW